MACLLFAKVIIPIIRHAMAAVSQPAFCRSICTGPVGSGGVNKFDRAYHDCDDGYTQTVSVRSFETTCFGLAEASERCVLKVSRLAISAIWTEGPALLHLDRANKEVGTEIGGGPNPPPSFRVARDFPRVSGELAELTAYRL